LADAQVSVPDKDRDFSPHHPVKKNSGTHLASYSINIVGPLDGFIAAGARKKADN
jgi:hypothetical protein